MDVVVEAVLHHGTDRELGSGKLRENRVRHQVRGGVAQRLQSERMLVRDDLDLIPVAQGVREIHLPAVHQADDGVLRQPGADLLREVLDPRPFGELDL